jgi:hypothetical protein
LVQLEEQIKQVKQAVMDEKLGLVVDGLAYRIIRSFYFRQAFLVGWRGKQKRVVVGYY